MTAVLGAIVPHGFPIIPELSDDAEGALATRSAMVEFGNRLENAEVDTIIIATPHGVRADDAIAVADVARGAGTLFWGERQVEQNIPVDLELTEAILNSCLDAEIPVAAVGFAGNRRDQSVIPLDWGVITPAWFAGHNQNIPGSGHVLGDAPAEDTGPSVVIVNPSRSLPREQLIEFGSATARAVENEKKRVGFVASCDWGHRHREDGPYGYSEASARVDSMVVEAVKNNQLGSLGAITDEDAEEAAIDGLWQALMLHGFLMSKDLTGEFLCYEAPSYYGMLVAIWD